MSEVIKRLKRCLSHSEGLVHDEQQTMIDAIEHTPLGLMLKQSMPLLLLKLKKSTPLLLSRNLKVSATTATPSLTALAAELDHRTRELESALERARWLQRYSRTRSTMVATSDGAWVLYAELEAVLNEVPKS